MKSEMTKAANLQKRIQRLLDKQIRVFTCPKFFNKKGREEILGDMPEYEDFKKKQQKVAELRSSSKISPKLRPCYEEPLLTREQEHHLFRQMNFYKYLAANKIKKISIETTRVKTVEQIEKFLSRADALRNLLATCNFRLATQQLKSLNQYYVISDGLSEMLLSDSYSNVIRSVDYFDYNRGIKFSTYCTWVLKNNARRDLAKNTKHSDFFLTGNDESFDEMLARDDEEDKEKMNEERKALVGKLLEMLKKSPGTGDFNKQVFIIESWYGLNDHAPTTLEQISIKMGITKERVRQLRNKGMERLKSIVKQKGLKLEELV